MRLGLSGDAVLICIGGVGGGFMHVIAGKDEFQRTMGAFLCHILAPSTGNRWQRRILFRSRRQLDLD